MSMFRVSSMSHSKHGPVPIATIRNPLRYASRSCRLFVLEYVRQRDQQLMKNLILDSNALLIVDCLASTRDLAAICKFCGGAVLSDRSLIIKLLFKVKWGVEGDDVRKLIVDTANAKVASDPLAGSLMSQHDIRSRSNPQSDARASVIQTKYIDPFVDTNFFPVEDAETGNSSLALSLMADNRRLFDDIMDKLDLEINLAKYITEYTNFKGYTLLHMAAARTSKRNEYCTVILKKCLTQKNKQKLLYAKDIEGNTIMHLVGMYAPYYSPDENRDLWNLMRQSLGKKNNATKSISLLFDSNEQNRSAMSLFVERQSLFADGFRLFKDLVMNTEQKTVTKYDIPVFARLLSITLERIKSPIEIMEIVRFTVNRFPEKLRPYLLSYADQGTANHNNILNAISKFIDSDDLRRSLMLDLMPIIKDKDLFLKRDRTGLSPINNVIANDRESALRMLHQFDDEQISKILMSLDTNFEPVISRGGSDMISQFMNLLGTEQLLKLYLETDDDRLFSHFQELCAKSSEMMTKLLLNESPLDVRSHDGTTFSMKLLQSDNWTVFNWITFTISTLKPEQIVAVLNQTDNMGNTALLNTGNESTVWLAFIKWGKLLSLCPDDEMKREYIIRQNFRGECAFDNGSSRIWNMQTADGDLLFGDDWRPNYRFQRAAKCCNDSLQWLVWSKRFLKRMGSEFVDSVQSLVPLFHAAALKYDLVFAQVILSKINTAEPENVRAFLTERATEEQATVFHFAARCSRTGIMKMLASFAESANLDLFELLSMKSNDGTDDTPLIVAVKNGRYRIIKYLLSAVPEKGTELILMKTGHFCPLNVTNFFKRDEHVVERNAVIWALEIYSKQRKHLRDLTVLKLLLSGCRDFKQLLELFHYSNTTGESIYHYMLTKEVCLYFENDLGVQFSKETWGKKDADGVTALMRAMSVYERDHSMEIEQTDFNEIEMEIEPEIKTEERMDGVQTNDDAVDFLQWILDRCCANNAQRLWLIYRAADNGETVLDLTSGAAQGFLVKSIESILSEKEDFDLESLIPIWLFALKKSDIDLAQRLMDLVQDDSDRLELVSCRNESGWSPILAAALSGHLKTMRFLEDQFQVNLQNFIEHRDHKGRSVLHYALKSGSREMVKAVLSLYMDGPDETQYEDLMIDALKDEMGSTPFSYFLKENGSSKMTLYLLNRFDDKQREEQRMREAVTSASGTRSKTKVMVTEKSPFATQEYRSQSSVGSLAQNIDEKLAMLFAKSKNGEIPLIEEYAVDMDMPMDIVSDHVYEFISSIKEIHADNVEMVGYCLLFAAQRGEMAKMQLIIEKINGDEDMLNRVLNVRNRSNHDPLYRSVATGNIRLFSWLSDVVPDDHSCLYSRSLLRGDTVFMRLLDLGQLSLASKLLGKISDNAVKLKLLRTERLKRVEGGGSALDIATRKKIEPVVEWITEQIGNARQ